MITSGFPGFVVGIQLGIELLQDFIDFNVPFLCDCVFPSDLDLPVWLELECGQEEPVKVAFRLLGFFAIYVLTSDRFR